LKLTRDAPLLRLAKRIEFANALRLPYKLRQGFFDRWSVGGHVSRRFPDAPEISRRRLRRY
jgi:hypothetical protein